MAAIQSVTNVERALVFAYDIKYDVDIADTFSKYIDDEKFDEDRLRSDIQDDYPTVIEHLSAAHPVIFDDYEVIQLRTILENAIDGRLYINSSINSSISNIDDECIEEPKEALNGEKILREEWDKGDYVEIFSRSKGTWLDGQICDIFIDLVTNKEWFIVKYGKKKKKIQRFCQDLRAEQDIVWVPNTVNHKETGLISAEKALFAEVAEDRKHKVISSEDERVIIKCIGRIKTCNGKNTFGSAVYGYGTGTVFDYHHETRTVFVITCAHNIVDLDDNQPKESKEVYFQRWETFKDKDPKSMAKYKCFKLEYHKDYSFRDQCPNDLAILQFKDDGYYRKIFENNNKNVVSLVSSDLIKDIMLTYNVYGYPVPVVPPHKNNDKNGDIQGVKGQRSMPKETKELHGMESESFGKLVYKDKDKQKECEVELYIKVQDGDSFYYNAIDTEPGQSGSAIFVQLNDEKYGIVGVHTGGNVSKGKNWGVALNNDKQNWVKWVQENKKVEDNKFDVKKWFDATIKLPEYLNVFLQNGFTDIATIKMLIDDADEFTRIVGKGIDRIKIKNAINKIPN